MARPKKVRAGTKKVVAKRTPAKKTVARKKVAAKKVNVAQTACVMEVELYRLADKILVQYDKEIKSQTKALDQTKSKLDKAALKKKLAKDRRVAIVAKNKAKSTKAAQAQLTKAKVVADEASKLVVVLTNEFASIKENLSANKDAFAKFNAHCKASAKLSKEFDVKQKAKARLAQKAKKTNKKRVKVAKKATVAKVSKATTRVQSQPSAVYAESATNVSNVSL